MPVYVIQAGGIPIVKIGHAQNVMERMAQHQVGHWERLVLIRQFEGGRAEEQLLHARFADLHVRGEWYSFSRVMMGNDLGLNEIVPEPETIPFNAIDAVGRPCMDVVDIIRLAGGASKLSRALCLSHVTILGWQDIPPKHVPAISKITGLPRHDIRPDLWESPGRESAA